MEKIIYRYHTSAEAFAAAELEIMSALQRGSNSLDFEDFGLESLPESLKRLPGLLLLNLDCNRFNIVPPIIRELPNLKVLSLQNNQLTDPTSRAFEGLSELRELKLGGNMLTTPPEEVFHGLNQLQDLSLSYSDLMALPERMFDGLSRLKNLRLRGNALTRLPEEIFAGLINLEILDISQNNLTTLPRSLEECPSLRYLYIHGNPALGLAPEVLGPGRDPSNARSILAAWRALQRGRRALNEAKVILVGRGGAGKTTLRKAMMQESLPDCETRTDGIELSRFSMSVGGSEVGLNVWDFGGQEVMYSTHRFFLTSRSLYLLVLDARSGPQDENVDYWLRVVEELGKCPPVLVVLNHVDENPGLTLDETGWKRDYPFIVGFVRTCAKSGDLGDLMDRMQAAILGHLPEARADFPSAWFSVKDKLTEMKDTLGKEHLAMAEYEVLCEQEKVPEDEREALLCLVRDLGLVSCYPEVPELKNLGVLRPEWLTDGIYSLITNAELKQKGGHISLRDVPRYLREPKRYAGNERFILDATAHFRLGFQVAGSSNWLLTALLDENTPEGLADWNTAEGLKLEMRYRVLPEGLVSQFISAAHSLSEGSDLRRWRNGAELQMDGATALVQGHVAGRYIRILVQGSGNAQRPLLSCIRQHFRAINAGLTLPGEYVPIPGLDAEPVKYGDLLAREAQGRATMEVTDRHGRVHDIHVAPRLNHYVETAEWTREVAALKSQMASEIDGLKKEMVKLTTAPVSTPQPLQEAPPTKVPFLKSWTFTALLAGLAAGALALVMMMWDNNTARIVLGVVALVFVIVLLHNPATHARRRLTSVIYAWVGTNVAGFTLSVVSPWVKVQIENGVGWTFNVAFAILSVVLGALEWQESRKHAGH